MAALTLYEIPDAKIAEPVLPTPLAHEIDAFTENRRRVVMRAESREQAALAIPLYDRLCAPPREEQVRAWLFQVLRAVRNPPTETEFNGRLTTVMFALNDLPAGVWTTETLMKALATFQFWPSVADISELLKPVAERLRRTRDGLVRLKDAPDFVPARPRPPEEREAYVEEVARSKAAAQVAARAEQQQAEAQAAFEVDRSAMIRRYEEELLSADPKTRAMAAEVLEMLRKPPAPMPTPSSLARAMGAAIGGLTGQTPPVPALRVIDGGRDEVDEVA